MKPVSFKNGRSGPGAAEGTWFFFSSLKTLLTLTEAYPPPHSLSRSAGSIGRFSGNHQWPVLGDRRGQGNSGPAQLRHEATGQERMTIQQERAILEQLLSARDRDRQAAQLCCGQTTHHARRRTPAAPVSKQPRRELPSANARTGETHAA
jgi:hypothetical protein